MKNSLPLILVAQLTLLSICLHAGTTYHLNGGNVGNVNNDFYYEEETAYGDICVLAWDLVSEPTTGLPGTWGNKTGLFVPTPYSSYGRSRHNSQPTSYFQIYQNEVGMCLNVNVSEISIQNYNPNIKYYYRWNQDFYPGNTGSKTWLYPYHNSYGSSNPRLQCDFRATIKSSSGTGVRHANTAFHWKDESSGMLIYVQHYTYDSRSDINNVASGYDPKIDQLWVAIKLGAPNAYHGLLNGSQTYRNTTSNGNYGYYGIDQSWNHFKNLIQHLNNAHTLSMSLSRNDWRLVYASFNLEMQRGHAGDLAGKCKDMRVWTKY